MLQSPLEKFIARWSAAFASERAKPEDVAEILDTLCTMGHAHRGKQKGTYLP